jgi:F-type H+-transporting ATPase subunit c
MFKKKLAFSAAAITTAVTSSAFAQEGGAAVAESIAAGANAFDVQSMAAIGAGIAIGLGVLGGTLGQGRAAAAALEGISRNPGAASRIQTPMILGLALIESLVLFSFVIAFLLQGKF